ncbi:MAG: class I SAM-dependent methyltransferase [Chloroflexi bacterium]|nr:class I SAM-dependent methyltransferase [Chloroflexota bacterium]
MTSAFDAWREQIEAHERDAAAFGGGHGHGHGHSQGQGHRAFRRANRALDPWRTDDPVLNGLYALLGADADVLDIGGGAGRYALPLATRARHVTVVEPSADSVEMLTSRAAEAGLANVTAINEAWEDAEAPAADVVLCSLVLHHVPDAVPFVTKMQEYAKDRVVLVEMMETPGALEIPFFERVYGSAPTPLPGLPSVLDLLWAMDIFPDVTMVSADAAVLETDRDAALEQLRGRLSVREGTEADTRLLAAAEELLEETPNGLVVRGVAPQRQAIVTWRPGRAGPAST